MHKYESKIARCFAFVGPHLPLNAHFAIGNFIKDVCNKTSIKINGDGSALRSYMYAADLAVFLWSIIFGGHHLTAYNVGSEEELSIRELAKAVQAADTVAHGPIQIGRPLSSSSPEQYVPSTRLAREHFRLHTLIPLSVSIHKTISWLKGTPGYQTTAIR
jgi:dTDP-glucose 4,6-dehydratase